MGFIGSAPAYWFLKRFYPGGQGVPMPQGDPFKEKGISKLATYFGPDIFSRLQDKTVIDFGCGVGDNALELAANGCRHVIGLDIQEQRLAAGRAKAAEMGLSDRMQFVAETKEKADVILSYLICGVRSLWGRDGENSLDKFVPIGYRMVDDWIGAGTRADAAPGARERILARGCDASPVRE